MHTNFASISGQQSNYLPLFLVLLQIAWLVQFAMRTALTRLMIMNPSA